MNDHRLNSALPPGSAFVPWFVLMAKPRKPVVSIRSEPLGFHRLKAVVSSRMNVPTKHSRRGFQTVKRIYAAVLETAKKK